MIGQQLQFIVKPQSKPTAYSLTINYCGK